MFLRKVHFVWICCLSLMSLNSGSAFGESQLWGNPDLDNRNSQAVVSISSSSDEMNSAQSVPAFSVPTDQDFLQNRDGLVSLSKPDSVNLNWIMTPDGTRINWIGKDRDGNFVFDRFMNSDGVLHETYLVSHKLENGGIQVTLMEWSAAQEGAKGNQLGRKRIYRLSEEAAQPRLTLISEKTMEIEKEGSFEFDQDSKFRLFQDDSYVFCIRSKCYGTDHLKDWVAVSERLQLRFEFRRNGKLHKLTAKDLWITELGVFMGSEESLLIYDSVQGGTSSALSYRLSEVDTFLGTPADQSITKYKLNRRQGTVLVEEYQKKGNLLSMKEGKHLYIISDLERFKNESKMFWFYRGIRSSINLFLELTPFASLALDNSDKQIISFKFYKDEDFMKYLTIITNGEADLLSLNWGKFTVRTFEELFKFLKDDYLITDWHPQSDDSKYSFVLSQSGVINRLDFYVTGPGLTNSSYQAEHFLDGRWILTLPAALGQQVQFQIEFPGEGKIFLRKIG